MKKNISVCLCGLMFLFSITLSSCQQSGGLYRLAEPSNFALTDGAIVWDEEPLATGYAVVFRDMETTTAESRFLLPEDLAGGVYEIEAQALGDDESYADSEWASFIFAIEEADEDEDDDNAENGNSPVKSGYDEIGLLYTLLSDGSGYEVSQGILGKNPAAAVTLTIPETFQGLPVKRIADYGFTSDYYKRDPVSEEYCNNITTNVVLPSTLEEIGIEGLACLTRIEEIVLPESVKVLGKGAFEGCARLKRVNLPYGITEIPAYCFQDCDLEEIEIPESVEKIGAYAFSGGSHLVTDFTSHSTESGTLIIETNSSYIQLMQSLKKIVIPDSVKIIEKRAFQGCSNLEEITLSKNLEWLGDKCFYDTKWLDSQPEGSVIIGDIFYGYAGQTPAVFTIPEAAKKIAGGAFFYDADLEEITIPDGVKLIGSLIFAGCKNLTKVCLPSDLTEIPEWCFNACSSLAEIELPETLTTIGEYAFHYCSALTKINLTQINDLGAYAFEACTALDEVILPVFIEKVGAKPFPSKTRIFYEGTEAEWNYMTSLKNSYKSKVYYYSESEPALNSDGSAYDGNYWRYVDGEVVVWTKETAETITEESESEKGEQ